MAHNADPLKTKCQEDQWQTLAKASQNADKSAYRMLLSEITPYIKSVLAPSLANHEWVDDITQDVLISVHKSLKTYSAKKPFKPWLNAIISFRKTDYLRKHYAQRGDKMSSLENPDFIQNHVTNPTMSGEYTDVERVLDELPAAQSSIFKKLKLEGYSAKEVAEEMDMSESAVKVSAHRTLKKLQGLFE